MKDTCNLPLELSLERRSGVSDLMAMNGNVFLMYHELELPGRSLCQADPGYVRYILPEIDFSEQMQYLRRVGRQGASVGRALAGATERSVVITFDDGCETDLISAAPILQQLSFDATFYVTAGFLGRAGYLSPVQLKELGNFGFEIGCHSMTHPYLPDLSDSDLRNELVDAKHKLEQILGKSVDHYSCPGGQFDDRVLELAAEAGYQSVANSEIHANDGRTHRYRLGRIAVMRGMSIQTFGAICDGSLLGRLRMRDKANRTAKRLFGNNVYDRMRALLLSRSKS